MINSNTVKYLTADLTQELQEELHDLYRALHAAPELSMQEHETATLIKERLEGLGFEASLCGGTGVVAVLRNGDGPVVGLRSDIDGLPVKEETGLNYASAARGHLPDGTEVPVMHACGHDMHITCAIGAATVLSRRRDEWSGSLVLIFQPGEETSEGALAMLRDGLWERTPHPEVLFGQHVWASRTGTIEVPSGPAMAMADSWKVKVHGRGGHGSRPQDTIDPVLLGAHMVVRIQSVVSRELHPQASAVVTVATFHAGLKENIIPSSAEFTVNVRTLDPQVRTGVLASLRRTILAEAAASGAPEPEIEELYRFPLLFNDPESTATTVEVLSAALGSENVRQVPPVMGSEDFGHLSEALGVPAVYWFFGGLEDDVDSVESAVPTNHSPGFAPLIEPTLTTGIASAVAAVSARLNLAHPNVVVV